MGCQSKVLIGDHLIFKICTHDRDTGILTDADMNPSYRIYRNENPNAIITGDMVKIDSLNTTGFYIGKVFCAPANGFSNESSYNIYITATVGGNTGGICYGFRATTTGCLTGDELKYRIAKILRKDTVMNTLLGKFGSPYGVYYANPPQTFPPFPLITFLLEQGGLSDTGMDSQIESIILRIKVYSLTNCDAIIERAEQLLNHSTLFADMITVYVSSIQLESFGPDDLDADFNCYTLSHNYKIYANRKPWETYFTDHLGRISLGVGISLPTEIKTQVQTILRADSTLQTLLGKTITPYGVYYGKPPQVSPPVPLVTFKTIGGSMGGGWKDSQTRQIVLQVAAYSKTNPDQIISRVRQLLNQVDTFTGMSSFGVIHIELDSTGPDGFDPEFDCYVATHRYRIFAVKNQK